MKNPLRKRHFAMLFAVALLLSPATLQPTARADLPGFNVSAWAFNWRGLWRREFRVRELARWYRHYSWRTDIRLWLSRRAEGVWVYRQAVTTFTANTHCVLRNPGGPGVWRIWRTFRAVDVRRFRAHYRVTWVGHINGVVNDAAPPPTAIGGLNARYILTQDHLEITTPMEPSDPNPATPNINEGVMIMDQNGVQHFLGEPGFTQLPDTAQNPGGFQLITTAASSEALPPAPQRIVDPPAVGMPGMALIRPGVLVEWLVDQNGNVLVDRDMNGVPDPILSPGVLGGQKHQGLIAPPLNSVPIGGEVEVDIDEGNTPLNLHCWMLGPNGEVIGAVPGQIITGPPVDLNGDGVPDPGTAFGGPIPMNPTVRDEFDQINPAMAPVDFGVVQEGPPTTAELANFNQRLQQAGFAPIFPPFQMCIRAIRNRHVWGIDRRFVMDTWLHHWKWFIRHHFNLTAGAHRVWVSRLALSGFMSKHHHFVVGQPPTWTMQTLVNLRFFRVCYRIHCPRPNRLRVKVDQLFVVVPVHPDQPNSQLMLITTECNENRLFQTVPPPVLAGLQPDPFPVGPDGTLVEDIDPVNGTLDIGGGGTGVFDGNLDGLAANPGTMQTVAMVGNDDFETALRDNQLQLYCWLLNPNGTIATDTFDTGPGQPPITFTVDPAVAQPVFRDELGNPMPSPTMLDFTMQADAPPACPGDVNGDGMVGLADIAGITTCWNQPAACNPGADQNGDGLIGLADIAVVTSNWATVCP